MKHVTLYLNVAMKPSPLSPASKVHRKKKNVYKLALRMILLMFL